MSNPNTTSTKEEAFERDRDAARWRKLEALLRVADNGEIVGADEDRDDRFTLTVDTMSGWRDVRSVKIVMTLTTARDQDLSIGTIIDTIEPPKPDDPCSLTDARIDELHEMGVEDAKSTGGMIDARVPERDLTDEEREIYDNAFRNAFARENGY